jgi:indolepyruvate ferredoxin oxidoreductase
VTALISPAPVVDPASTSFDARLDFLAADLVAYQDARLAADFRGRVDRLRTAEARALPGSEGLARAAMETLYKVSAIKDEYEVARHHSDPAFRAKLAATFEDPRQLRLVLAPPILARHDPATGRPRKTSFGPWILPVMKLFAELKRVRGTWADLFGHTAERKAERALRDAFRGDVERMVADLDREGAGARIDLLLDLAIAPREAKGYGPIKDASLERVAARRREILARLDAPQQARPAEASAA